MSKHHPKAYMRERAAAGLKVANGLSIRQVAAAGVGNGGEVGEGLRTGRATGVVSAGGARAEAAEVRQTRVVWRGRAGG